MGDGRWATGDGLSCSPSSRVAAPSIAEPYIPTMLRRIELWWRRLWIRWLVRLMKRPDGDKPSWSARPMRVLFLRHDRVGDMIVSTGVMRAIARPHGTITL